MYNPLAERMPDVTFRDALAYILHNGEVLTDTPQDEPVRMCFGTLPPLVYNIENGVPVITERKMGWRAPVGEMCAFINGVQDFELMKSEFGVPEPFWGPWVIDRKTKKVGARPRHLGDASYGPAIAAFPMANGGTFDQIAQVVNMLRDPKLRTRRTMYVTPWIPYWNSWGGSQRAVVSPCHGWMHFRVINGSLDLLSWHRSADMALGFANDMIAYAALLLMVSTVTDIPPRRLIFQISDAHIYQNQEEAVREMISREPRVLPILSVNPAVTNIRDFRSNHFELLQYHPRPAIQIPGSV